MCPAASFGGVSSGCRFSGRPVKGPWRLRLSCCRVAPKGLMLRLTPGPSLKIGKKDSARFFKSPPTLEMLPNSLPRRAIDRSQACRRGTGRSARGPTSLRPHTQQTRTLGGPERRAGRVAAEVRVAPHQTSLAPAPPTWARRHRNLRRKDDRGSGHEPGQSQRSGRLACWFM